MRKKNRNPVRGFTLVELIVVLAILSVLLALIVPRFTSYTETSQAAVCRSNRSAAMRQYTYLRTLNDAASDADILSSAMTSLGGKKISDTEYTGICPAGGTVTATLSADGKIEMTCSIESHGSLSTDTSVLARYLFSFIDKGTGTRTIGGGKTQSLNEFFKGKTSTRTIDSNSPTQVSGNAQSWTSAIKDALGGKIDFTGFGVWQLRAVQSGQDITKYVLIVSDNVAPAVGDTANAVVYTYNISDGSYTSESGYTVTYDKKSTDGKTFVVIKNYTKQ